MDAIVVQNRIGGNNGKCEFREQFFMVPYFFFIHSRNVTQDSKLPLTRHLMNAYS